MLIRLLSMTLCLAMLAGSAWAGDHHGRDEEHGQSSDQDRALAAVLAGRVVPLQRVLDKVQSDFAGKMIQVELEDEGKRIFYEVKLLTEEGRLLKLRYDAASMVLLNGDSPEIAAARRK